MAKANRKSNGGLLGFEAALWAAADKLRGHMDAAEYKHVVLGLIFLKYISDAFEARRVVLAADPEADPEDPDEYLRAGVFWVPKEARWQTLQEAAKRPEIGLMVDKAMDAIERDNHRLKGVLPKDYARSTLDKTRLGELIDLIGDIGLGEGENHSRDILGRVYEYFLGQFASREGKKAGEFYTPRCVVKLLVEMIEPYQGRVYDPCCGSSGMFVQSEQFIHAHGGRPSDISVFGQESNPTTWKLAKMNLALRGIEANLGPENADTFARDLHSDLKADFILANPPFNMSDWGQERLKDDVRWKYGVPPAGNANFAWVQHMAHHLAPNAIAGFVLSNGSMSSMQSGEGAIRQALVEDDLVDCMVALPGQLFYGTAIPACLWFVARDRSGKPTRGGKELRDRRGEVLFIDARGMGEMVSRIHRELTIEDIAAIARTYHAWRAEEGAGAYEDVAGLCGSAALEEIRGHGCVLTPGRYVGVRKAEEEYEDFETRVRRLVGNMRVEFKGLEEVAQAVFQSWFIDFDPVRRRSTVPDDIRALFPDRLVESQIGPVPEGWEVAPLGEHVEVTRGLSYTGAGLTDRGMPLHNLNSIREGGSYKEDGIKYYMGEYRERDRVRPGDVIVANTDLTQNARVIGYPAIVPRSFGDDGLYSHHIYRLRPADGSPLTPRWLYLLLVGQQMHAQVVGYANGTTVNMLPKDGLKKPLIAVPPRSLVERFDGIVAPMLDQQETLTEGFKALAELRDTLLTKLISGEMSRGMRDPAAGALEALDGGP